jgi:putative nucleotidyltransferase with HDIG domain
MAMDLRFWRDPPKSVTEMGMDTRGRRTGATFAAGTAVEPPATPLRTTAMRVTATVPAVQILALRIDHLVEAMVKDRSALRRTLPEVATQAIDLCSRPGGDALAMERTLTRDPLISAQVISLASSAMLAPRPPVRRVRDAVVAIGLDGVRDLALLVATSSIMLRARGLEAQMKKLRRRVLASASAAYLLARVLRARSAHGFLAGLLHDIGELVLVERCAREGLVTAAGWDHPAEGGPVRERIQAHHTSVGAALCRSWRLPACVADAAQFHHHYRSSGRTHLAAHLAAAADALVPYVLPDVGFPAVPAHDQPVVRDLGLAPERVRAVIDRARPMAAALAAAP